MATHAHTPDVLKPLTGDLDKHPHGVYVLFATERWERFGFYTTGGMFALDGPCAAHLAAPAQEGDARRVITSHAIH